MRGRINLMDLYDAPFNLVHELYYYTFTIKEEREKEMQEEKKKKEEEEKKHEETENTHASVNKLLEKRLSPAAQAREMRRMKKSQDDEKNSSEDKNKFNAGSTPPLIDMEDIIDTLEEGG